MNANLLDRAFYQDLEGMHEAFTWMRANQPVYHDPESGFWGVTRHRDIIDVERRDRVFSSNGSYRARLSIGEDNMIAKDNPGHLQQRRLVVPTLVPAGIKKFEPLIRKIVEELVDEAAQRGRMEVVEDLAGQLPGRLTAHMIGFGEDHWREVKTWSERLMRIDSVAEDPQVGADFFAAISELGPALEKVAHERRECPADDLVSTWLGAGYEAGTLFNETGLFVSGGAETTRTVIARGLAAFCDHPDQWELLADNPALVPTAVEELLRWVTPLNQMFRRATEDTTIAGVDIPADARIALLYPSGNRDEDIFDRPFEFDVTRSPNPHVAFGNGTHFCVGANLARMELRILFEALTSRLTGLEKITEPDIEPNIFAGAVRSFELGFRVR